MTALNIFCEPAYADFWTDGAWLDETGKLGARGSKLFTIGELPAVVAIAGRSHVQFVAAAALSTKFGSYDELADGAAEILSNQDGIEESHGLPNLFVMAGWSDRENRILAHAFASRDIPEIGVKAWQRASVWRYLVPNPPRFALTLEEMGIGLMQEAPLQDADGLAIIRGQRDLLLDSKQFGRARAVGCFAQHTRINRHGVSTRIVEQWPDKVGEPLRPPKPHTGSARDPFKGLGPGLTLRSQGVALAIGPGRH